MSQCPFLNQECIKQDCALWLSEPVAILQLPDRQERLPNESMCSLVASGLAGIHAVAKFRLGE